MQDELTRKEKIRAFLLGIVVGLVVLAVALYQVPAVQERFSWRIDFAKAFVRGIIDPVKPMPTPVALAEASANIPPASEELAGPVPAEPTRTLTPTATTAPTLQHTPSPTPTQGPTLTPTPLPGQADLPAPKFEKQEVNNCGPATLAMHLRFYGWNGNQTTISSLLKPKSEDRNVNVEELVAYVNTEVPGLEIQYRVGGNIDMLRQLVAAGFPVTIEEAFKMEESYWFNDDRWSGHYLLVTGYDDTSQRFTAQDVFVGPNISVPYQTLDKNWKAFNRVYILVYPTDQRDRVQAILGEQWDVDVNRQAALDLAEKESKTDPTDSFAWFNLGTNLVYFEKYSQAAQAYDEARKLGLPQRFLRYQFGPFFAYFHTSRMEDLLALTEYALKRTPNSEEALLWRGWAMYRQGDKEEASNLFLKALTARPGYSDAVYALDFIQNN
jgi:tetratricopeptide (TPR) repeat protein